MASDLWTFCETDNLIIMNLLCLPCDFLRANYDRWIQSSASNCSVIPSWFLFDFPIGWGFPKVEVPRWMVSGRPSINGLRWGSPWFRTPPNLIVHLGNLGFLGSSFRSKFLGQIWISLWCADESWSAKMARKVSSAAILTIHHKCQLASDGLRLKGVQEQEGE